MTTPRDRQSQTARVHPTRTAPRPGWGNQNARRRPEQWAIYRAVRELHRMLKRGPWTRSDALAYLCLQGIGFQTAHGAAALIGVPSNSGCGRVCQWRFPEVVPPLDEVLARIREGDRHIGRKARHQRGLSKRMGEG